MYSHIQLGTRHQAAMVAFYDAVLAELGLVRINPSDAIAPEKAIWTPRSRPWPRFVLRPPINGLPATWGNGCQVSFAAPSAEAVASAWSVALARGGSNEGEPGLRLGCAEDFYAAYCRDLEGNKICFAFTRQLQPHL